MRDVWPSLLILCSAAAAFAIALVWSPYAEDAYNLEERLDYCEADLAIAATRLAEAKRMADAQRRERDVAARSWKEWQGWYEQAHADRTRLASELAATRTKLFQAQLAASPPARVVDVEAVPLPKRKPAVRTVKKHLTVPGLKPRKTTKRIVYDWSWLFGHD
jgi:hypothetical protein